MIIAEHCNSYAGYKLSYVNVLIDWTEMHLIEVKPSTASMLVIFWTENISHI
jgi:hypothetical protein